MTQMRRMMRRMHGAMFKLPLMISCDEFESFILAYLEGELTPRQTFVFEMHLKVCRECRDYLKAYKAAAALSRSAFEADPTEQIEAVPEDLVKAVLEAREA